MDSYPYAVVKLPHNWSAGALQWQSAVTAPTRAELDQLMAEDVALRLYDYKEENHTPPSPKPEDQLSLDTYRNVGYPFEVVYVEAAPLSTLAILLEKALQERENTSDT